MARYDNWRKLSGDTKHGDLVNEGKKLLGFVDEQRRLSGNKTLAATKTMANGALVSARFVGNIPMVDVREPPTRPHQNEDAIYAYLSSPGGLRIFDLNDSRLYRTLTGLQTYEVDGVSSSGQYVFMTGGNLSVRVNLGDNTAFGYNYTVNALAAGPTIVVARAEVNGLQLSHDESKVLVAYARTYDPGTLNVIDGLGGYVLADATTLAPIHTPYRMSSRKQVSCFAPDGRFFIATTLNTDPGDVPSESVSTSDKDYISEFSATGALISSRLLYTWSFAPDTGWTRTIDAVAASPDSTRLYVAVNPTGTSDAVLYALDLEAAGMPVLGSMVITGTIATMAVIGNELIIHRAVGTSIVVVNTADFTIDSTTTDVAFTSTASGGLNGWTTDTVQPSPLSPHKFFLNNTGSSGILTAYQGFANGPFYTYDFDALPVSNRYRLVGVRGSKRSSA